MIFMNHRDTEGTEVLRTLSKKSDTDVSRVQCENPLDEKMKTIKDLILEQVPGATPVESQIRADAWIKFQDGEAAYGKWDPATNKEDHLANAYGEAKDKLNYYHMHFMQLAEQDPEMLELVKKDICCLENIEMEETKMLLELRGKEALILAKRAGRRATIPG